MNVTSFTEPWKYEVWSMFIHLAWFNHYIKIFSIMFYHFLYSAPHPCTFLLPWPFSDLNRTTEHHVTWSVGFVFNCFWWIWDSKRFNRLALILAPASGYGLTLSLWVRWQIRFEEHGKCFVKFLHRMGWEKIKEDACLVLRNGGNCFVKFLFAFHLVQFAGNVQ